MPKFFYKARKGPKKLEQGTIEAESEPAAINKLTQLGYFPINVTLESESAKGKKSSWVFLKKIRRHDLSTFTRQLSNLLESGLPLYRALRVLEQQTENRQLQAIIHNIVNLVKEGQSLSDSLRNYPFVFNNMYVSMVKTGEVSGTLGKVLKRLADFSEKQEDIMSKVQAALAYPMLMALIGIATIVVLFAFVIPNLVELFEDLGEVLPLPTRVLIALSELFLDFWWLLLAVGAVAFFAIRRNLFTAKGRLGFDHFKLRLPVLGRFLKMVQISNFSRTLGTLLANGVPILQAMDAVAQTLQSEVLKQETKVIAKQVKEGATLAGAVAKSKSKYFPLLVANMLSIGEEAGTLEASLLKIAETYEKETDQSIKLLTSLIEPVMILVMGSIVGFIVISMLLPIFQISLIAH